MVFSIRCSCSCWLIQTITIYGVTERKKNIWQTNIFWFCFFGVNQCYSIGSFTQFRNICLFVFFSSICFTCLKTCYIRWIFLLFFVVLSMKLHWVFFYWGNLTVNNFLWKFYFCIGLAGEKINNVNSELDSWWH